MAMIAALLAASMIAAPAGDFRPALIVDPTPSPRAAVQAAEGWNLDDGWFPEDMRSVPLDGPMRTQDRQRQFTIAKNAVKYLGTPYKFGGSSLTKGIDSSHFIWRILTISGADCPSPPVSSQETVGRVVHWANPVIFRGNNKFTMSDKSPDMSVLRTGDRMIFHRSRGWKWHTALYLGKITYKGRNYTHAFAHASGSRGIGLEEFGPNHRYCKIYQYSLRDKWNE